MNVIKPILFLIFFSCSVTNGSFAQPKKASIDNEQVTDDSVKVSNYLDMGLELLGSDIARAIYYFDEAILLGQKINYQRGLAKAHNAKGRAYAQQGDLQESIISFQEALKYFRETNDKTGEANILSNLGSIYYMLGNSTKALELHFESLGISEEIDNKLRIGTSLNNIGTVYLKNPNTISEALTFFKRSLAVFQNIDEKQGMATASMNIGEVYFVESKYDSAIHYLQMALSLSDGTIDATFPLTQLGQINAALGNFQKAYSFHKRALDISENLGAKFELTQSLLGLAKTQSKQGEFERAITTLERAKSLAIAIDAKNELLDTYSNLAEIQSKIGNYKAAYENEINTKIVKEEIAKSSTEQMIQQLQFEFELNKKEAEIELLQKDTELKNAAVFNQRVIILASLVGLLIFIAISVYLFRNNLNKQKANRLLQAQKEEIDAQRERAEFAFDQLKSTQAQLIQSEKMASLGELTAGIAHEIKNPLNFVNNFSELSSELIDEMKTELVAGNQKLVFEIADDIKRNLQKIYQHGKRADTIVQGMLEHSRTSLGEKEETDINTLADEYLRLAYHGLIAKDKSFHAEFQTAFDPNLPKIEIVHQDIGRVLLNIINNAFYAVNERSKKEDPNYKPTVILSTKVQDEKVLITVRDNGTGIPEAIKDKIFQPFFTTKPTGKGTGLGLSLSYDIVKAHEGELKVKSVTGQGVEFTIVLPLKA
jgi:two-component system, NtrC family, sensor kinase